MDSVEYWAVIKNFNVMHQKNLFILNIEKFKVITVMSHRRICGFY